MKDHIKALGLIVINFLIISVWAMLLAKVVPAAFAANSTLLEGASILGLLAMTYGTVVYYINLLKSAFNKEKE